MSTVGASRLRLASWGNIPIGAELANLVPFSSGADTVLVAVDSLGNYSWPFVWGFKEQLNKDSLVKDTGNGVRTWESPDLTYTVMEEVRPAVRHWRLQRRGSRVSMVRGVRMGRRL
jgi:hypothetical protein